jgi:nondiscriminating glutamyl-tRNA synthetase
MSVRVRYAPSPTGDATLGSLRTIIFNYLFARQNQGTFILRIEDTDQAREVEGSLERQLEAMYWMGLVPDEGVYLDEQGNVSEKGSYGPYIQSKRLDIYKKYADQLVAEGKAYPCFCTPERLEKVREEQQKNKQAPRYDRHCRNLSKDEVESRIAAGEKHVIRQAVPDEQEVICQDIVRGEVRFNSRDLDDQVLLKSDGFPTYQLANIIDDHLMEITHVLRGDEWLPSLPKNILMYQAFGWEPPQYAHLPVILGPDGRHKLSKRDGNVGVLEYRDKGYLPEALFNVLAFVGWSPGTEEEFFTVDQLIERFRLDKVQKSPAAFSFDRLDFVDGWYIRHLPVGEVVDKMLPYWKKEALVKGNGPYELTDEVLYPQASLAEYFLAIAGAVQERLKHFDETYDASWFFFKRPVANPELRDLMIQKNTTWEEVSEVLKAIHDVLLNLPAENWTHDGVEEILRLYIAKNNMKAGQVLWPIRAALTGVKGSPGTFEMLSILGKDESMLRLKTAINVQQVAEI